jgi:hypothetical protein
MRNCGLSMTVDFFRKTRLRPRYRQAILRAINLLKPVIIRQLIATLAQ